MPKRSRIVVLGSLVFDFVARAPRLPRKGETILGDMFGMFPGGKGANQAVQAGRLEAEVFLIGRVGDDFLGDQLMASLKESNVRTEHVKRDRSVRTAACCIHVDAQGDNSIVIVPEANLACSPADVDEALPIIQSADILLCQLEIPLPTVSHAARLATANRVRVILNPAPAQPLDQCLLAHVDYLTPNEQEAESLTGISRSEASTNLQWEALAAKQLLQQGPDAVVLTLGERGAYLGTNEREQWVPGFPVQVVDATAAGDAFNGALAVALAEGKEIGEAIFWANAAGALATTRAGAQPSLAHREAVESLAARRQSIDKATAHGQQRTGS